MITVENLLDAYAQALDLWLDPELAMLENGHPRKCPTPEYAELIRKAVSAENTKLRDLVRDMLTETLDYDLVGSCRYEQRARELGIEVDG